MDLSRDAQALDELRGLAPGAITPEVVATLGDHWREATVIRDPGEEVYLVRNAAAVRRLGLAATTAFEIRVTGNGIGKSGGELYALVSVSELE